MRTWVLLVALATSAFASSCYYPDGNKADDYDYQPCGSSVTTFSTCCYFGEGDVCLENGLCKVPNKYDYYRAACANKDWSGCPEVCMDEDPDNWLAVEKCGENKYCCPSSGSSCCTNGAKIYTLNATNPRASGSSATASSGSDSTSTASSSSQTTTSEASSGRRKPPVGIIVGTLVGGTALIIFCAVCWGCYFRRRSGPLPPGATARIPAGMVLPDRKPRDRGGDDRRSPVGPQVILAEVEGAGKVLTSVELKPVAGTGFDEKKPFYVQSTPSPVQNSHQQGIAEAPGSMGTTFTEVDSTPVTQAALDEKKPFYTPPASSPAQHVQQPPPQGVTEVEGESNPIPLPHVEEGLYRRGVTPEPDQGWIRRPRGGSVGTRVEGSAGEAFTGVASNPGTHDAHAAHVADFGQWALADPGQQVHQFPPQGVAQAGGGFRIITPAVETNPGDQFNFHASNPFNGDMTSAAFAHHSAGCTAHRPQMLVAVPQDQLEQLEQFWQSNSYSPLPRHQMTPEAATPAMNLYPAEALAAQAQRLQQAAAEAQGNPSMVFTETDSRPVNPANPTS
ncbi:hypothetical protein BGZ61DRAFT_458054 [Ilyonectria robusta]|uniref:uncharacterized protein n=1 Tax=Ilyonectria robusta TaxID=1079257 RepID=UPI001E8CDC1D|nr:uncharacterized protein BGZ61DRAFT_458054 [Ilyonectria robusta]KAH8674933.1 hypothetical protein BGZ61DRAFT_458054 [Ilyonectria robusta]